MAETKDTSSSESQYVGGTARMWDNENEQPFISREEGPAHGYWGQRATNAPPDNAVYTVAEVTKDLPGPSGTAVIRPGTKEAEQQAAELTKNKERREQETAALRSSGQQQAKRGDRQ
jgi:hypothetical protein